jgi:Ion channel
MVEKGPQAFSGQTFPHRLELIRRRRYASRCCLIALVVAVVVSFTRWSRFAWIPAVIAVVSALSLGVFLLGELLYGAGYEKQTQFKNAQGEFYRVSAFRPSISSPTRLFNLLGLIVCGVVFGYAELYLSLWQQGLISFSQPLDAISGFYFSFVTFATIGYGDFYPLGNGGRLLVSSEIAVAFFVIAAVFAISISWILSQRQQVISARNEERDRRMQTTEQAMREVKVGLYQDETDMDAAISAKMEEFRSAAQS